MTPFQIRKLIQLSPAKKYRRLDWLFWVVIGLAIVSVIVPAGVGLLLGLIAITAAYILKNKISLDVWLSQSLLWRWIAIISLCWVTASLFKSDQMLEMIMGNDYRTFDPETIDLARRIFQFIFGSLAIGVWLGGYTATRKYLKTFKGKKNHDVFA